MGHYIDLESLDDFLMSDDSPDGSMFLSDLDGFLHGIVCSPVIVPREEWMARGLGAHPYDLPKWVTDTVREIYINVIDGLTADPPVLEPIFWETTEGHVIAMDWCEGFMDAVALRPTEWMRLTESGIHGPLIDPIMAHILDENSVLGISHDKLDQGLDEAAAQIPASVVGIFRFWRSVGQVDLA